MDKLLEKFDTNFDLSYDKLYKKIRLLEGEIYHYISELTIKNNYETYNALLKVKTDEVNSLAIAVKTIKDMLYDLDVFYNATSAEEQKFYKNMRYQIVKSVRAFHRAYAGDEDALQDMDAIYKKIQEANKQSTYIIKDIANNRTIKSDIITIAINDIHAIKTFSKALYKILKARQKQ